MAAGALIAAFLIALAPGASAFYSEASAPTGWAKAAGGGQFKPPPGTQIKFGSNGWAYLADARVSVGGRSVVLKTALRSAPSAARVMARRSFGVGAWAPAVALWAVAVGLEWWWDEAGQSWMRDPDELPVSTGYEYKIAGTDDWTPVLLDAVNAAVARALVNTGWHAIEVVPGDCSIGSGGLMRCVGDFQVAPGSGWGRDVVVSFSRRSAESCPSGWYVTAAGCVQTPQPVQVTPQEFEDALAPHGDKVPQELVELYPDPVPVELPYLNPQPDEWGNPWPVDVPVGDPVPNPTYDPEAEPAQSPYTQPMVRITPRVTPAEEWRVDLQPWEKPVETPDATQDPYTIPLPDGAGNPTPPGGGSLIPGERTPGLCDVWPGILACVDLGEAEEVEPTEKKIEFEFAVVDGFSGAAGCPAPIQTEVLGREISLSWEPFCDSLVAVKPLMLAMAWLGAAFILLGRGGEG